MAKGYARLSEVKIGSILTPAKGFSCLQPGDEYKVKQGNSLYIDCADGNHYLWGHLCYHDDTLVGLYKL